MRNVAHSGSGFSAVHVAIVSRSIARALLSGEKRIESRLSRHKHLPFNELQTGDRIFFKLSGGPIVAAAFVRSVRRFRDLTATRIMSLARRYNDGVRASAAYWRSRTSAKYAIFAWLRGVERFSARWTPPRQFGAGWIVLRGRTATLGVGRDRSN